MGRYTRKERRIGKVAVMEVTQVVGVRTRARTLALAASAAATSAAEAAEEAEAAEAAAEAAEAAAEAAGVSPKRRKAVTKEAAGELQMAYLQLRSRSLVMKQRRFSKSARNSDVKRCGSVEQGRISRCSSIASCEVVEEIDDFRLPSAGGQKLRQDIGSSVCNYEFDRDRRDITSPSNPSELDSTAERELRQQTPQSTTMPSAAEIDNFFSAAEKSQKQQFAARYNFDVDNEVPLNGRYDWVRIN